MKKNLSKFHERGQAMVELATMLVILLTLLAGIVDFGRAFFTYITLRDAAQEGASYGSVAEAEPLVDSEDLDYDPIKDIAIEDFCDDITQRVRVTTEDFSGSVSNSQINLQTLIQSNDVSVTAEIGGLDCYSAAEADVCYGAPVTVRVTYDSFPLTMPFLGTILGTQHIPLSAEVVDTILTPSCKYEEAEAQP
jgi:Flp pilus assembly protein TadG